MKYGFFLYTSGLILTLDIPEKRQLHRERAPVIFSGVPFKYLPEFLIAHEQQQTLKGVIEQLLAGRK